MIRIRLNDFIFIKYKTIETTASFLIFWDFWMFDQIFLWPQVKRCAIISYKHGTYDLPRR